MVGLLPETNAAAETDVLLDAWDFKGRPAPRATTGRWGAAAMILGTYLPIPSFLPSFLHSFIASLIRPPPPPPPPPPAGHPLFHLNRRQADLACLRRSRSLASLAL